MAATAAKPNQPKGELLSIAEIGRRCKLHPTTVKSRLVDLNYEPDPSSTPNNKLFPFDENVRFEIMSAKDTASAMKIRDLRASAELKEIKVAEARKELVPMNEAAEMVQRIVSTIYQEYTVRQPKRIGNKLAKAKTPPEIKAILKQDSDKIMKSLRENFERFIA